VSSTFSESWHRVANARLSLLPTVAVNKQRFRGQDWYVLRDTYTQRFFRVTPQAYAFLARLAPQRTVEEVWQSCLRDMPTQAPGQEEVMALLGQMHQSNLLYHDTPADSLTIFDRYRDFKRRELQGKVLGFLSIRIPLWDPNRWLDAQRGFSHALVSWPMALVLALLMVGGGMAALAHSDRLWSQTEGLFVTENLVLLYVSMAVMKALHELGHAHVVKRFGGEVHTFGIMLLMGLPLPYVDATGSWSFRDRHARALVGAAGIIVELVLAAVGALVWAYTGPGLVNSLAFNVMIIGSVSSLLFNGNPLLRFDAYYVLSDLVDIPNLYQRAGQQWKYMADRYLLGTRKLEPPTRDPGERAWLVGYGAASFVYRVVIFATILLVLADVWLPLAVAFLVTLCVMAVAMPIGKLWRHLRGPATLRNRRRASAVVALALLLPLGMLALVPWPDALRAPGVVEAVSFTRVHTAVAGRLHHIEVAHGGRVEAGQLLVQLVNPELDWEIDAARAALAEARTLHDMALQRAPADVAALRQRIRAADERLMDLLGRRAELMVRARHAGSWSSDELHQRVGNWLARGQQLGELVNPIGLRFSAVVSQEQARALFERPLDGAELRLAGQSDRTLVPRQLLLLPYQQDRLASPALGWSAGGSVPVKPDDPEGTRSLESFFELQAIFDLEGSDVAAWHGMTGWLRVPLPAMTLLEHAERALRQLLQKRYAL
jgi:putative peptide zinc metalloprotease protein